MKHLIALGILIPCMAAAAPASSPTPRQGDMVLWYDRPGVAWLDAMPIGNGMMAAMVFGGTHEERIALNESSFWSGRPHDYNDPEALTYFPKIRDLVFAGKFQEAEKMADEHFYGAPPAQQAYQPLGDLLLSFDGAESVRDYRRELDMETGVTTVRYRSGDAVLTREVFVSYPDRVMVVRITADKPGHISLDARLKGPYQDQVSTSGDTLIMYTDGLIEAMDAEEEEYEFHRLKKLVLKNIDVDVSELRKKIFTSVQRHIGTIPLTDDFTLLIARLL